jgi:SSS family solute:Na+ symporter
MLAAAVLQPADWLIIAAVIGVTLAAALLFTKRAGKGLEDFFVSGRSLPWWLAGTSIVATTFACDTPIAITEMVRTGGIWKNWLWWSIAGGHILGAVMMARLWRRSRLVTDVSLIELRYDGPAAKVLQVFRAGYFGIVWNMIVIGWVTAAMLKIFTAALDTPLTGAAAEVTLAGITFTGWHVHLAAVAALMTVAVAYSLFSGLWGIVVADLLQFIIALAGAVILAVYAVDKAGGMEMMLTRLAAIDADAASRTALVPDLTRPWELPAMTFFVFVGLFWYTDKTADSGGYIAQRLLAAKDERHGMLAMVWFVIAHYALRPWPWIIAAIASLVLLPEADAGAAYPQLIMAVLPVGLRGLLIASLLAAFISTVNTQLNWGASYLTRDVYMVLWRPRATQRELVWVGRVVTLGLMVLAAVVSFYISSIEKAWKFLALLGAGSGIVLVGRWLWWRINAASEIVVLAAAFTCGVLLRVVLPAANRATGWQWSLWTPEPTTIFPLPFALELPIVVAIATTAWVLVTFCTRPTSRAKLIDFYRRCRPPGPGWSAIATASGISRPRGVLRAVAVAWAFGVTMIFSALAGIGDVLLLRPRRGLLLLAAAACAALAFHHANRRAGRLLSPRD